MSKKTPMNRVRVLRTVSLILGIIFLLSVLTVESHAHEKGSLAAKCPTVIESTLELAVGAPYENANQSFGAIGLLPIPLEVAFFTKSLISPYIYRSPPLITL